MPIRCFLTTFIILQTVDAFIPDMKYIHMNKDKTGLSPFKTLTIDDVLSCTVICEDDPLCVIFAFHAGRQQCNIYHQLITDSNIRHDAGMKMFKIGNLGENIAFQMATNHSSMTGDHGSSLAVDGDNISTCFITEEGDFSPYFTVDLADIYHVLYVTVYNTIDVDNFPERLHDVNIELYLSDPTVDSNPVCCGIMRGLLPTGQNIIKCQDGVMGRFVTIYIEKSELMTLCEVEITGHKVDDTSFQQNTCNVNGCKRFPNGSNIALGKPTLQSSTWTPGDTVPLSASLAVDGNRNGHAHLLSCSHTAYGDNAPWLQVDLELTFNITSVTIVSRTDNREYVYERMTNVSILVYKSDAPTTPIICKFIPGIFGMTSRTFECDDVTIGRYVRIAKDSADLDVCELEVTGNLV